MHFEKTGSTTKYHILTHFANPKVTTGSFSISAPLSRTGYVNGATSSHTLRFSKWVPDHFKLYSPTPYWLRRHGTHFLKVYTACKKVWIGTDMTTQYIPTQVAPSKQPYRMQQTLSPKCKQRARISTINQSPFLSSSKTESTRNGDWQERPR